VRHIDQRLRHQVSTSSCFCCRRHDSVLHALELHRPYPESESVLALQRPDCNCRDTPVSGVSLRSLSTRDTRHHDVGAMPTTPRCSRCATHAGRNVCQRASDADNGIQAGEPEPVRWMSLSYVQAAKQSSEMPSEPWDADGNGVRTQSQRRLPMLRMAELVRPTKFWDNNGP
jgi:hypothetical protein